VWTTRLASSTSSHMSTQSHMSSNLTGRLKRCRQLPRLCDRVLFLQLCQLSIAPVQPGQVHVGWQSLQPGLGAACLAQGVASCCRCCSSLVQQLGGHVDAPPCVISRRDGNCEGHRQDHLQAGQVAAEVKGG
jgi:hypothetical protein